MSKEEIFKVIDNPAGISELLRPYFEANSKDSKHIEAGILNDILCELFDNAGIAPPTADEVLAAKSSSDGTKDGEGLLTLEELVVQAKYYILAAKIKDSS